MWTFVETAPCQHLVMCCTGSTPQRSLVRKVKGFDETRARETISSTKDVCLFLAQRGDDFKFATFRGCKVCVVTAHAETDYDRHCTSEEVVRYCAVQKT